MNDSAMKPSGRRIPRPCLTSCLGVLLPAAGMVACAVSSTRVELSPDAGPRLAIPKEVATGPKRPITTDDLIGLRDIDTLTVSPDGTRYAILVRQADAGANDYRTGWFVGAASGGALTFVGDGGQARLRESPTGLRVGEIAGSPGRWSPDSQWLAYTALRNGEVQVWAGKTDGSMHRQVTRNDANVREFAWGQDGRELYYTAGTPRQTLAARDESSRRNGFLLEEFQYIAEVVHRATPDRPLETDLAVWAVTADGSGEHRASEPERAEFEQARRQNYSWGRSQPQGVSLADIGGATAPPIASADGSLVWMAREKGSEKAVLPLLRLTASRRADGSSPVACKSAECVGQFFSKVWWSADSSRVIFWRREDANLVEHGFYSWSPESGEVKRLFRHDGDEFAECDLTGDRLICAREMVNRPDHVVAIELETGTLSVLADVNPEFQNITLGKVERFEWDAPADKYKLGYPSRIFGYIIYPPDFDAKRRYPVFIAPYGMPGFRRGDVGDEHPLFVYAASGLVVLSTQFPIALGRLATGPSPGLTESYSVEHDFPHLTMLADSTFRALDAVSVRGFVDKKQVGIGGLSHGAFVPLYMLQKHDRIAAISIAGPGWSQTEYYGSTRTGRTHNPRLKNWPESTKFWSRIDIADHVEKIEAPLMVNYPDREFFHDWRLPRKMENAGRAYEAHIYPGERHVKWQPAHRYSIYKRNLDWFRFWLQDVEDPASEKQDQYQRWHQLRELQCKNRRSLRNHCQGAVKKPGG